METMCTKKGVLIWSVALSLFPVFLFVTKRYDYKDLFLASFVFLLVCLFSLITYFLPEAVFRAWARFTTWWIPLQILAVVLTPESSGGF
ncbi:MAG: hypothetical protein KGH56_03855, partial [Patescibacteria group bacterium]|nr:hypothetical protein [Patescibacteria group bacterium]